MKLNTSILSFVLATFFVFSSVVPILASAKAPKCSPREGHCVVVMVNGQFSVPVSKSTSKLLKQLDDVSYYVNETAFEIPEPISGELQVFGAVADGAEEWFGEASSVDIQVVPLQPVEIASREALVTDPTVRIGGQPAVSKANVMEDNTLPPGRYLLRVKLIGSGNWDRQTLYVTVDDQTQ